MPKHATVVLCDRDGTLLGEADPVTCETPWWQEVTEVVAAMRQRDGIDITVLRMLEGVRPGPTSPEDTSNVIYLAELQGDLSSPALRPTRWSSAPHPLRLSYARPGGPAELLGWANDELARANLQPTGAPVQMRTWNLSAIWRIPTNDGITWLKAVPPFFAHEPAMIAMLTPGPVPELIARAPGRSLLRHVDGRPVGEADRATRLALADVVVGLQRSCVEMVPALLAAGCFDNRASTLVESLCALPAWADDADRAAVETLVASLPERFAELTACGIPETLVHGDAHLGNALVNAAGEITLLDWGDASVGHPCLDVGALERWRDPDEIAALHQRLIDLWSDVTSPARVRRAIEICRPIGALLAAQVYARFVDNIEPSEHPYHQDDPAVALRNAVGIAGVR